ncbi:hypothetical protein [Streptomyces sp. NPDC002540]
MHRLDTMMLPQLVDAVEGETRPRFGGRGPDAPDHLAFAGRLAKLVPGGHTATVSTAAPSSSLENPARSSAEPTSFLETV